MGIPVILVLYLSELTRLSYTALKWIPTLLEGLLNTPPGLLQGATAVTAICEIEYNLV